MPEIILAGGNATIGFLYCRGAPLLPRLLLVAHGWCNCTSLVQLAGRRIALSPSQGQAHPRIERVGSRRGATRSVVEQSSDELGAILPEHEDHAHEALAGDPAGRHRERELGRQLGILPLEPPAEDTTKAHFQARSGG